MGKIKLIPGGNEAGSSMGGGWKVLPVQIM